MQRRIVGLLAVCAVCTLSGALVGCGNPQYRPTTQEAAGFKGGPMPAAARQKMMEMMRSPKPIPKHP